MKVSSLLRAAAVVAAVGLGAVVGATPAFAQPVAEGSLAFSGDPGDWITGGGSYAYSTAAHDRLTVTGSDDGSVVSVNLTGANGDWWTLDLAAPAGQALTEGVYEKAHRYPFQGTGPGLSLSGDGRGCNELSGRFTVESITWGPQGYLEELAATFEQHCEHGSAAARGEVRIVNPPAPEELSLDLGVSTEGTASTLHGRATVRGAVSCNVPARVQVSGLVTQVKNNVLIRGQYATAVDCAPGAPVPWSAEADPTGTTPFQEGRVEVKTRAVAQDPNYSATVEENRTTVVTLVGTDV